MIDVLHGPQKAVPPEMAVPSPALGQNELRTGNGRSNSQLAREIVEAHQAALRSRRQLELTWEKYILHVDGAGDFQWADIFNGQKIEIPRLISEWRKTENLLRPIVENAIAHHTTIDLRYFDESTPDWRSVQQATLNALLLNHGAEEQDFNGVFADALAFAFCCGFGTAHAFWRDGPGHENSEPVAPGSEEEGAEGPFYDPTRGSIDCFVGNPFSQTFDVAARKGSWTWSCYERVLNADVVRDHFGHIPGVSDLEGTTHIPSAAEWQRIARSWNLGGLAMHGDPSVKVRRGNEEVFTLLFQEIGPYRDSRYPEGRLRVLIVPGKADLREGRGKPSQAVVVADQALPGETHSFSMFYSLKRGTDIHGKPWVEDKDQLQVDLNIALSKRWEYINKMMDAPIVTPGGAIGEDMAVLGAYNVLEVEPSLAAWRPRVVEWPQGILQALNNEIDDKRNALYTLGGYQAVSRGESPGSRMAYRAIVALQQADSSIHGPINKLFRKSAVDFAQVYWKQFKAFGDVPWMLKRSGDEYEYLLDGFVDKTKLSEQVPNFTLVNAFGPSPEMRAEEILQLVAIRGTDGEPFMTTEEARRQYPNQSIFDHAGRPGTMQRNRARTIAAAIHHMAESYRRQHQLEETEPNHPWVEHAAQQIFQFTMQRFPQYRDDDLFVHIATLTEIVQDETADAIARKVAQARQEMYYQWQEMQSAGTHPEPQAQRAAAGGGGGGGGISPVDRSGVAAEMQRGDPSEGGF